MATAPLPPSAAPLPIRSVAPIRVLSWLRLGARDLARTPLASLAHGLAVAAAGWIVIGLSQDHGWLAPAAFSGFVALGPILCTGLYELSRLLGRGEAPGLADAMAAWRRESRPLVRLGLFLLAISLAWVGISGLLFALFLPQLPATVTGFLRYAAVEQGNLLFALWLAAGGLGAALVFALTAVSPPLMLGRKIGFRRALLTSVRAVGDNPLTMGLWACVILLAIVFSLATAMVGFVFTVPLIGHATWHAYRDLVVTEGVALRHA